MHWPSLSRSVNNMTSWSRDTLPQPQPVSSKSLPTSKSSGATPAPVCACSMTDILEMVPSTVSPGFSFASKAIKCKQRVGPNVQRDADCARWLQTWSDILDTAGEASPWSWTLQFLDGEVWALAVADLFSPYSAGTLRKHAFPVLIRSRYCTTLRVASFTMLEHPYNSNGVMAVLPHGPKPSWKASI